MSRATQIHIRHAVAHDAPQLAPLLRDVGFPASTARITDRLSSLTAPDDHVFVAVDTEAIVGVATLHLTPALHRPSPVGRITLLVVAEHSHGKGVGRALVRACEQATAQSGGSIVEVISNLRYSDAHDFYRHLGYVLTSHKFKKTLTDVNPCSDQIDVNRPFRPNGPGGST